MSEDQAALATAIVMVGADSIYSTLGVSLLHEIKTNQGHLREAEHLETGEELARAFLGFIDESWHSSKPRNIAPVGTKALYRFKPRRTAE